MNRRFGLIVPVLLITGILALAWFSGGFFHRTDVCTHCGALQRVRLVLWIPFSDFQQTPLSLYLQSLQGNAPGGHHWQLVAGAGGPIRCALGNARSLIRPVKSLEIVEALKNIRSHRGDAAAKLWTDRILDPKTSSDAFLALYLLSDPNGDFDSDHAMAIEEFQQGQLPPDN